jgi:hypothetical protein
MLDSRMMLEVPTAANRESGLGQYRECKFMMLNRPNGPYTNYFLYSATGEAVSVILEITPTVFTNWHFGNITKFGTWTGGEFLTGEQFYMWIAYSSSQGFSTTWNSIASSYGVQSFPWGYQTQYPDYMAYVYNPVNSYGDYRDFAPTIGGSTHPPASGAYNYSQRAQFHGVYQDSASGNSLIQQLMYRSPNAWNNRTALFPTYLTLYDEVSQRYILSGHVEGVRHIRMDLIDPKETVEVEWDVYPHYQKSGDQMVAPISGPFGLAFKRVV